MATAMSLRINISFLVSLFLLLLRLSPVQGFGNGVNQVDLLHKGWRPSTVHVHVNPRKLLKVDATLDYDYAGANPPKHRRGGNGGKNP